MPEELNYTTRAGTWPEHAATADRMKIKARQEGCKSEKALTQWVSKALDISYSTAWRVLVGHDRAKGENRKPIRPCVILLERIEDWIGADRGECSSAPFEYTERAKAKGVGPKTPTETAPDLGLEDIAPAAEADAPMQDLETPVPASEAVPPKVKPTMPTGAEVEEDGPPTEVPTAQPTRGNTDPLDGSFYLVKLPALGGPGNSSQAMLDAWWAENLKSGVPVRFSKSPKGYTVFPLVNYTGKPNFPGFTVTDTVAQGATLNLKPLGFEFAMTEAQKLTTQRHAHDLGELEQKLKATAEMYHQLEALRTHAAVPINVRNLLSLAQGNAKDLRNALASQGARQTSRATELSAQIEAARDMVTELVDALGV